MSKSRTYTHKIEVTKSVSHIDTSSWIPKYNGRATQVNFDKYVTDFNKSFLPGGVNFWANAQYTPRIIEAQLVNQASGETVARYDAIVISR